MRLPAELEQKAREIAAQYGPVGGAKLEVIREAMLAALRHAVDEQKRLAPDLVRDAMLWREAMKDAK